MNEFVNYLNSTNNVGGNSTGSLAETQVKSCYYDSVKVDRNLGNLITNCISSGEHQAFILTGHAGDGKTSILVQVLKALGRLQNSEGLCVEREYSDFFYIKDMSEIPAEHQVDALRKTLLAPSTDKTSLLISNTGPLLKTFESLVRTDRAFCGATFDSSEKMALQSTLLSQLDENKDEIIQIENYSFILVNIARVDNVPFASKILKNIISPDLWAPCNNCSCSNRCPIKNNRDLISAHFDRVASFIDNYYRYLYENDKRMTIRQMVGQISYAITGNLTCSGIHCKPPKEPFFNWNFANLFFGYCGLNQTKDSAQIKGIEQIQNLSLDRIALDVDYKLFVSQDYSCFDPKIESEIKLLTTKYRKHYQVISEDQLFDEKRSETELQFRRAIRRFYLVFSRVDTLDEVDKIMNQIFGAHYAEYRKMILANQSRFALNQMRNVVFEALFTKNTGFLSNGKTDLPLTLRREDDVFQSVMIVLGQVPKTDLNVVQQKSNSRFEDTEDKQDLYLKMSEKKFRLTLPMITYFGNLIDGAIQSNNNPALTHGIAKLDALLLEEYGKKGIESEGDCELTVIINTTHGQKVEKFYFDGNRLLVQ